MGRLNEEVFKSSLVNSGYSVKTADEIWKWYTATEKK